MQSKLTQIVPADKTSAALIATLIAGALVMALSARGVVLA